MLKKIFKRLIEILLYSAVLSVAAFIIAFIICKYKNYDLATVIFTIGIIIAIISGLSLLQGDTTGSMMGNIGRDAAGAGSQQYSNLVNAEASWTEKKTTGYWNSIKNHGLMNPKEKRVNVFISGIVICIISLIMLEI